MLFVDALVGAERLVDNCDDLGGGGVDDWVLVHCAC